MRSTGEVMGMDEDLGLAYAKSQMAAKPSLPTEGNVFLSVKDADKPLAVDLARQLEALGFKLFSTSGTADTLQENGVAVTRLFKLDEGRPTVVDMIKNDEIQMIINTPSGMVPRRDENVIRSAAYLHGLCIMTTITGAQAALNGIKATREKRLTPRSLQSYAGSTVRVG
jgi:carbamoyl-phosphate synthase large subunit